MAQFDARRQGEKGLKSFHEKNEGAYRSGEEVEEPAQ